MIGTIQQFTYPNYSAQGIDGESYQDYARHSGQLVRVISENPNAFQDADGNVCRGYLIEADDGWRGFVWPGELREPDPGRAPRGTRRDVMRSRVTTTLIRSGQPEAYRDTEYVCVVEFERTDPLRPDWAIFEPDYIRREEALRRLARVDGYNPRKRAERSDPFESYLDYVKMINPEPSQTDEGKLVASVWEFRVVTPFTD